jgi:Ferredoxin-like domain in Api92-like protein
MPNWVFNGLTIEGNPDSVTKLVSQLNQPYVRHFEDAWDKNTKTIGPQDVTYSKPVFAFWNIIKPTDMEAYVKQPDRSLPIEEQLKFQGDHWYDWNIRNWGTKWDVSVSDDNEHPNTYMEGPTPNGDNLVVFYNFDTAWGLADAALITLSSQYPDLLFTLSFEEETGWGGEWEILRGKVISQSEYETKCNECDAYDTLSYCEDCENDVCSTCGYGTSEEGCSIHPVEANV